MKLKLFAALAVTLFSHLEGCGDFLLKCQDGTYVSGRSLEFGMILPTHVEIHPSGEKVQSKGEQKGLSWNSKYAYMGLFALEEGVIIDGFNEKGLTYNILWFPDGQYPEQVAKGAETLDYVDLGKWVLGNFSTVEEVKENLGKISLYFHEIQSMSGIPPIHLSLHDAQGKSIVVEFLKGKMEIFDNPIGVLTNSPAFPWHLINLRNYINLSAINAGPVVVDGKELLPTGQGSGLKGLPGDWTPPSRFIRLAFFKNLVEKPKNAAEGVVTAFHILNTVDIPYGTIRSSGKEGEIDFTQWVTVADLANQKLFVRTYNNLDIQEFALEKETLTPGSPVKKLPIK